MSIDSWNRGLDDAAEGEPMREQGTDYKAGYRYAQDIEDRYDPRNQPPEPTQPDEREWDPGAGLQKGQDHEDA